MYVLTFFHGGLLRRSRCVNVWSLARAPEHDIGSWMRLASLDRYSSKLNPWSEQWRTTTAKLRERIGLLERFVYCMLR